MLMCIAHIYFSKGAPLSSVIVSSKQSDSISVNETINGIYLEISFSFLQSKNEKLTQIFVKVSFTIA